MSEYTDMMCYLLTAYREARRHKANTASCIRFSMNLEEELDELARTIMDQTYTMRRSIRFPVKTPVLREVIAADFRDRVPHHYVYDYVNPHLELELIDDCYSCRVGRGTGYGVDRLEHHIRSCSQNYTRPCWVLQLDLSGYFMSINRQKLLAMAEGLMERIGRKRDDHGQLLGEQPRHRYVAWLLRQIILYDPLSNCEVHDRQQLLPMLPRTKSLEYAPPGVGMPIGNLTSQMLSNLYLNGFCHWVKRVLRVKHFGDYVDDTYYISHDREWLLSLIPRIQQYLAKELDLRLNLNKTRLTECKKGVSFLGIHLKPYRRYVKSETLWRMRQQIAEMSRVSPRELQRQLVRQHLLACANSYLGVLCQVRSFRLRMELFPTYPFYRIAYATGGIETFRQAA